MQKRSSITSRRKPDINQAAKHIVDLATGNPITEDPLPEKNPAAVALGRLGGLKGGKARAEKLSAKKRTEIAKKAAQARWSARLTE
jgi:hypothetical protein